MRNYPKHIEKKTRIPVLRYLGYLLLVTTIVTGVSFSRYSTSLMGEDSARVAKFSIVYGLTDPREMESTVELDPSIYATCKLSDAENCDFNKVAVVRTIEVTNESEVRVSAAISDIAKMSGEGKTFGDGIVWCMFDGDGGLNSDNAYQKVRAKLGYASANDVPEEFSDLQAALNTANNEVMSDWNDTDLGISQNDNSKKLTIVFWSEYDPVTSNGLTSAFESPYDLKINISQID